MRDGFSVLGRAETLGFLAAKPVGFIWGVGKAMQEELAKGGITMIGQLQQMEKIDLMRRFGSMGARLYHLSRGEDARIVSTEDHSKSISAETTFNTDIKDRAELERILWPLAEKVSRRAKAEGVAGHTVVLKLKTADFKTRTRNVSPRGNGHRLPPHRRRHHQPYGGEPRAGNRNPGPDDRRPRQGRTRRRQDPQQIRPHRRGARHRLRRGGVKFVAVLSNCATKGIIGRE